MTTFPLARDVNLKMDPEIKARVIVYAREAYARFGQNRRVAERSS